MVRLESFSEGHRGDFTEDIINITNEYLLGKNLALVSKISTPVKVMKRQGPMIVKAFFEEKSILDYIGVCQGLPIAFDSKETNLISLPLANIAEHQYEYIENFIKQDGYAFILCNFKKLEKIYLIPGELVVKYYKDSQNGGRKSIPEKELDKSYEVKFFKGKYALNYLTPLNLYYKQRKEGLLKLDD